MYSLISSAANIVMSADVHVTGHLLAQKSLRNIQWRPTFSIDVDLLNDCI